MASFNRTFMELKLQYLFSLFSALRGFNRTFMELKYEQVINQYAQDDRF